MPPPRRVSRPVRRERLRDRFFTRRTAQAIMAPASIVAAGAGAALGLVAGLEELVAVAVGAVAYAGAVAVQMPRRDRSADDVIDPRRLRDPWRHHVREALEAEQRFSEAVDATARGPLRDRLDDMRSRVSDAVAESWRIANRGQQLELALGRLEPADQLERKRTRAAGNTDVEAALRSQIETWHRIEATAVDTRQRLQVLEARLDETVARAIEVGLRAGDPLEIGAIDDDVESLVDEMEALRRGLDETSAVQAVTGMSPGAAGSDVARPEQRPRGA